MQSIARSMEARTEGKEEESSPLSQDGHRDGKKKAAKIAKMEHAKDLGAITTEEFKSQVCVVLGFESDGATA